MKRRMLWAIGWALALAACEGEPDPTRGGLLTAQFRVEEYVALGKLAECSGDAGLLEAWFQGPRDSLPVIDGAEAAWGRFLKGRYDAMLSARSCDDLLAAWNDGLPPPACETPGRSCQGDVLQDCRSVRGILRRFDLDCSAAGLSCREGSCVASTCVSNACDGDTLIVCGDDGRRREVLCGAIGLTCGHGASGLQCVGRGNSCSATEDIDGNPYPRCVQNRLVWCLGGREASVDCAGLSDSRRSCSQGWINDHPDVTAEDLWERHLPEVCGPTGTDCQGAVSDCEDVYLKVCMDGYFEWQSCRDARTGGCGRSPFLAGQAACTPFP